MHHELLVADRLLQLRFQALARANALVHVLREILGIVAAQLLGAIHGAIGIAQQQLAVHAVLRGQGDADAGADAHCVVAQHHGLAERVAGIVAQAVVDLLEAVQVDEQQGEHRTVAADVTQRLLQAVAEHAAVLQTGEWVEIGETLQLGVQLALLAGVLDGEHDVRP